MTELNTSQISKLKVAELKEHLESRGLATDGKKDELVSRLTQAIEAEKAKGKETETTEEHQTPAEPEQQAWVAETGG